MPQLPKSPFGAAQSDDEASGSDRCDRDWYVPQLPQSPFGAAQSDDKASSSDHSDHANKPMDPTPDTAFINNFDPFPDVSFLNLDLKDPFASY